MNRIFAYLSQGTFLGSPSRSRTPRTCSQEFSEYGAFGSSGIRTATPTASATQQVIMTRTKATSPLLTRTGFLSTKPISSVSCAKFHFFLRTCRLSQGRFVRSSAGVPSCTGTGFPDDDETKSRLEESKGEAEESGKEETSGASFVKYSNTVCPFAL